MPPRFVLVTRWQLKGPIDPIWEAIYHSEGWPNWWKYVRRVELLDSGDAIGVGAVRRYTWSSRLPYRLTFDMRTTLVERPRRLGGEASGELSGRGMWTLDHIDSVTSVRYEWQVDVTRAWMAWLSPLLAPAFRWNHAQVMRAGARGLAAHLRVPLLSF
ncbi:MAG TPA: SRPBCC family protein [Steroidobacteraceae bacterium]|nr:SRPBCC family protein [Steroidobacteraceae bacterium]